MSTHMIHAYAFVFALLLPLCASLCPFASRHGVVDEVYYTRSEGWPQPPQGWEKAIRSLDFNAVRDDLRTLFNASTASHFVDTQRWPADYGYYGPFFVRLAWHNAGSYRTSDGRGGADGGRQRFEPEASWDDNTNLDKARALLWPIKQKYGVGLSWGDLIMLAGNTAIQAMGGPILGFCAGRIDDPDGKWSQELGPSTEQQAVAPCEVNGECKTPLGSTTIGLIYLNPEGPMGEPIPEKSAGEIRDSFGRMAMNDTETVALIGGGHAFGKAHGACPAGAGSPPKDAPLNPWPGKCGTGKGVDTFTSGFEGPWTTDPLTWDNQYFKNLANHQWVKFKGPGGKWMWRTAGQSPQAPAADLKGDLQDIMMMTSDVSLTKDPEYQKIVAAWADDQASFDNAFAHAWYKLTTRDMGPHSRCFGNDVPPPQDWQKPLPSPPSKLADFSEVRSAVRTALTSSTASFDATARVARLAWRCASTFRVSDYLGGCNGASVRLSPQKDWPINAGLDAALDLLAPVKAQFGEALTWADLIVAAGSAAVEAAGGDVVSVPVCGGRSDAAVGVASDAYLLPRVTGHFNDTLSQLRDTWRVMGVTTREGVALSAQLVDSEFRCQAGYMCATAEASGASAPLSSDYFETLLTEQWEEFTVPESGLVQYKAKKKEIYVLRSDVLLLTDPELKAVAQEYAADNGLFVKEFAAAWVKMANADRFDGPTGNVCDRRQDEDATPLTPAVTPLYI